MGDIIVEKQDEAAYNMMCTLLSNGFQPITPDQIENRKQVLMTKISEAAHKAKYNKDVADCRWEKIPSSK